MTAAKALKVCLQKTNPLSVTEDYVHYPVQEIGRIFEVLRKVRKRKKNNKSFLCCLSAQDLISPYNKTKKKLRRVADSKNNYCYLSSRTNLIN